MLTTLPSRPEKNDMKLPETGNAAESVSVRGSR